MLFNEGKWQALHMGEKGPQRLVEGLEHLS